MVTTFEKNLPAHGNPRVWSALILSFSCSENLNCSPTPGPHSTGLPLTLYGSYCLLFTKEMEKC